MMLQATSFKEYYESLNSEGNANVAGFNKVINAETHFEVQVKALNNPEGTILIVYTANQVRIIHGLKNFGNNIVHPEIKICNHIGMSRLAFVGTIDHTNVLSNVEVEIQN